MKTLMASLVVGLGLTVVACGVVAAAPMWVSHVIILGGLLSAVVTVGILAINGLLSVIDPID